MKKVPNHINGGYFKNILRQSIFKTGVEFPQYQLLSSEGQQQLADIFLGDHFYLLGWNHPAEKYLSAEVLARWHAINGRSATICDRSCQPTLASTHYVDPELNYQGFFQKGDRVVVIRPDKMIVIHCKPRQLEQRLNQYLDSLEAP